MTHPIGCDFCNKSSLSLLLLRPSPVAKAGPLVLGGSNAVLSDAAAMANLLPSRVPTESRFALRLLRSGYVHVYIESPPVGIKNWLTYRVTDNADLIAQSDPLFPAKDATCTREKQHNATGYKLLSIPQAHQIKEVWIAYSANLWSVVLQKKNKANPLVMQKISLGGGAANTFKPTAANLKLKVLECAPSGARAHSGSTHDFKYTDLAANVDQLAENLVRAAAGHPKTKGKELAVVLRDPVGMATDLNELRLRRYELAKKEMEKKEYAHPLNSSNALMGLKQFMLDDANIQTANRLGPKLTKKQFESSIKISKHPSFAGATWEAVAEGPGSRSPEGQPLGRVWTEATRKKYSEEMRQPKRGGWGAISSEYNEEARLKWLESFDKLMKQLHFDFVEKFESDWWEACQDILFENYFALHFDENDPNDPNKTHSPGIVYAREVTIALTPSPFSQGVVCTNYVEQLKADVTQPSAVLLRALGANQKEVVATIKGVLATDKAGTHMHEARNDKLYDFGAGVVLGAPDATSPNVIQRALVRFGWLSVGATDVLGAYTLLISQSMSTAVTAVALRGGVAFLNSPTGTHLLTSLQSVQLIQRATDLAYQSIFAKIALKTPMIITKRYPLGDAMTLLGARGGHTNLQIMNATSNGFIEITFLTDNHELSQMAGDMDHAIAQGAGKVTILPQPALLHAPATLRTVRFNDAQLKAAWLARLKEANGVAAAVKEITSDVNALCRSLDGRLALGVILINGVGLIGALKTINDNAATATAVRDAWVGMIDSSASVLGGLMQVFELMAKASVIGRLGADAARQSVGIHTLRATGLVLGAVAGVVNAVGQFAKATDANRQGYGDLGVLYILSSAAFLGTSVTGGLAAAGAIADRQIAKQIASVAMQRIALRYGISGTLTATVSGWGLVLLGAAILFEVGAVVLTPTEVQEWVQRSYFGNGKGENPKFAVGDWESEMAALEKIFAIPPSAKKSLPSANAPATAPKVTP